MEVLPIILVAMLLLALCQVLAIVTFWRRFSARLRAQEPAAAVVVIRGFGPDALANSRALARYTRLDTSEIDEVISEGRCGRLPLPLSWRRANLLATELRSLGGEIEIIPR